QSYIPLACLLAGLLLRCGSDESQIIPQGPDGPDGPDGPETPGTPITDEARLKALEECRTKAAELDNLNDLEDKVQFVAWLYHNPAFATAGLFSGIVRCLRNVYGRPDCTVYGY